MRALLLLVLLPSAALAGDPPRPIEPASLVGKHSFEWTRGKTKCKAVDAAVVKRWVAGFTCMSPDPNVGTASGKPLVASCKATKGRTEHLVFATKAECIEELQTQAANGD